jgi:hypothetical protein
MLLKGALHVHTTCSDGTLTIEQVLGVYSRLGFDFIALTDHDYLLRPGAYDRVPDTYKEMIIYKGVELTIFEKGYVHVNRISGDRETLHIFNHPAELDLPIDKVIERINAVGRKVPIDVVEITSKGFKTPAYDSDDIPFPKIATDDSHTRRGCGRAWIEMDCRRDKDVIIQAVKKGDFWNCYTG